VLVFGRYLPSNCSGPQETPYRCNQEVHVCNYPHMLDEHVICGESCSLDQALILHIDSGPLPVNMKPDVGDPAAFRWSGLLFHVGDARPQLVYELPHLRQTLAWPLVDVSWDHERQN